MTEINFRYMPIKYNFSSRHGSKIQWIVVHYTGNYSATADAMAHYRFFNGGNRNASAHYFVDDKNIIQIVGDSYSAWAVGDNQGYGKALNGCYNRTSISIEMCVNKGSNQELVYRNTVELVKNLMKKFNVPAERVCRHYDVSRKDCPHNLRADNWQKWWQLKEEIKQEIKIPMDLSEDNVFKAQEGYLEQRIEKVVDSLNDVVTVEIDGNLKELRGRNIDGTNYVSIRDFANIMGLQVGWNQEEQKVILRSSKEEK